MTKKSELLTKMLKYQKILDLQDWEIVLKEDCENEKDFGSCEWWGINKKAIIQIGKDENFKSNDNYPFENWKEKTLIHELLHIKTHLLYGALDCENNRLNDLLLHQFVEDIAKSIYKLVKESD